MGQQPSKNIVDVLDEASVKLADLDFIVMHFPDSKNMPNLSDKGKIIVQNLKHQLIACFSYERDSLGNFYLKTIYQQRGLNQADFNEEADDISLGTKQEISEFASIYSALAVLGKFIEINGKYTGIKGHGLEH